MAYYGNQPIAGETNSFKVLDDISSYTKTFDGSSAAVVSTSDDTLTFYDHRFIQGQRVTYGKGGGTVVTGLTDATVYYVIREDKDTIKLATSASNAATLTAVNLTGVGAGASHTLIVAFDGTNTKFKATTGGGTHIKLTRPGQLMISMNGVVQEPQNNTPTNGFGIESNNVIVFSTAPTVLDTFWGHYLTTNLSSWEMSDNKVDNFTGNGSTTTYTLSKTPANAENILVTIDGVIQYPSESGTTRAYILNASVVTFTSAPALNAAIQIRHIGFAGGGSGGGSGGVTGFYGRTGNVSVIRSDLQNTDINLKNLTGVAATFTGNVSIGGTLTYTDVTNIDAVGIITAQAGIHLGIGATAGKFEAATGITTFSSSVGIADSIHHIGNTDTAIRFPSDDIFTVETAGSERLRIDSTGNSKFVSNERQVIIQNGGTSGQPEIAFRNAADNGDAAGNIDGSTLDLRTGGTSRLNIDGTGATNVTGILKVDSGSAGQIDFGDITTSYGRLYADSNGTSMGSKSNHSLFLKTNDTERVLIDSGGILVTGTMAAKGQVTASAVPPIAIESTVDANDFSISQYEDSNGVYTLLGQNVQLDAGGSDVILDSNHKSAGILIEARNHGALFFYTGGTNETEERARLDSSGRLLLGTDTEGRAGADELTIGDASGDIGITIRSGTSNEGNIYFGDSKSAGNAEQRGIIRFDHSTDSLQFFTADGNNWPKEKLRIKKTGEVGIGTDNPYAPLSLKTDPAAVNAGNLADKGILLHAPGATDEQIIPISASFVTNAHLPRCGLGFISHPTADPVQGYAGEIGFYTHDAADGSGLTPAHERMRISRSGYVGIGLTIPNWPLTVQRSSGTTTIGCKNTGGNASVYIEASDGNTAKLELAEAGTGSYSLQVGNDNALMFFDDSSERMRIDSSGRVKIGGAAVSQNRDLVVASNAEANLAIETHNDATSESSNIRFYKSGASPLVVETDDNIARIQAYGHDGTDYNNQACGIDFAVDGTPASNIMPGKIIFKTNSGGTSPVEKMIITKDGEVQTKNRGDQKWGLSVSDEFGVWGSNTGLAPNSTRTWTVSQSSYGWGRFVIGGGDGNYQRAALVLDYGGVMWSTNKSYYYHEVLKSGSGVSISTTYNNDNFVVSVTAGSNWWYYTVNLIQGRRDSSSWATVTQG